MLTPAANVTCVDAIEKAASSVQSVSRKILARRKVAKERNSKVGHFVWRTDTYRKCNPFTLALQKLHPKT